MSIHQDHTDDHADKVRQIEAEAAPTRFARGWHCLGLERDFRDGQPHQIKAFGQKLVVFAGADGQVSPVAVARRCA